MENCNGAGCSGKSQQKISHLSFLVALLQSIGFEPDHSCPSGPPDVQDLVDFLGAGHDDDRAKGTTVTITCGYSKKTCTLRLPEKEESCNCLAEEQPFEVFRKDGDARGLKGLFDALLKHLRREFVRETKRLKESFELDSISLTSIFPDFHNISITSETFTEYSYDSNLLNETYTVRVLEVPTQPSNKVSMKRCPSEPPATRPKGRRHSIGSKPNKFEPKVSPKPIYLKPEKYRSKSSSLASVKSENFIVPHLPKSPSGLSTKSDIVKHTTRQGTPIPAQAKLEMLKSKKPMEAKLKTIGTVLKNSTVTIRRSFGLTTQNKYVPSVTSVKPTPKLSLDSKRASTPIPTRTSISSSTHNLNMPPSDQHRSSSTERYSKIPMSSSGMIRSTSGVLPKLN